MQSNHNPIVTTRQSAGSQIPPAARRYLLELAALTSEMASSTDSRVIRLGVEVLSRQAEQLSEMVGAR